MDRFIRILSITFAAGAFGALVNSLVAWRLGVAEVPKMLGVSIAPSLTAHYLYARIVWGGLWGFLFLLPFWRSGFLVGVFSRGVLFSLIPTVFQLFYVFPVLQGKGVMGMALGSLTPFFVFFYNVVWGISAAIWLYMSRSE